MSRIPSLLEITSFFAIWLGLWLPFAIPSAIKLNWRPFQPSTAAQKLPLLASLYLLAPLVLWGFCWVEGTSFTTYGMSLAKSQLAAVGWGFAIGSASLALLFAVQYGLGWLDQSPTSEAEPQVDLGVYWQVLLMLGLALWIGWTEELIFRGFLQNQLQRDLPVWLATAVASGIFALLHGVWEGKSVLPQLPGLWLMGMVLVLARWVDSGNLGLAWGLHAGWVWVIASLDALSIHSNSKAPAWLTGLAGKPLAGILGLLFLLSTGLGLISRLL
ncbi:MAG: CPBP family intramembrane metalloprotease [Elainella sp. C42_A2020_010]|nr:CPBP family intramembrane metalloprotease [Elainella sp. C42_A2020_010]RNJ70933.1 MAG: CPBP family intramembrane metalloprotease [Leptolyngbya sp. IPPAS B-1204]